MEGLEASLDLWDARMAPVSGFVPNFELLEVPKVTRGAREERRWPTTVGICCPRPHPDSLQVRRGGRDLEGIGFGHNQAKKSVRVLKTCYLNILGRLHNIVGVLGS